MFSRSGNPLLIFLQSYHVWVTSKIQVDFRFKTYSEVLLNVSYRFLKFLDYIMFLGSRNPLLIFLQSYHVWVTSKIQVDFRFNTYSEVLVIVFLRVRESVADIPTELPCSGNLENSGHLPVQEVFEVTQTFLLRQKCSKFISNRAKRCGMVTRPMLYCQLYCHVTSCHVMSRHSYVIPRHVTSCNVLSRPCRHCHVLITSFHTSRHVISHHGTPCHVMSRHVTSYHVTSCYVMSCDVTSCHVIPRHATSRHVMSRHVTSCHFMTSPIMSRPATHVTSCHVMSRHVTPCHIMSRYVTSRHVTSCHALSRHVTLCHAM